MKPMEVINLAPENVEFHAIIEQEVVTMEYGQMTVNVQIENGKPILKSLSLVKSRRKKYTIDSNKNML